MGVVAFLFCVKIRFATTAKIYSSLIFGLESVFVLCYIPFSSHINIRIYHIVNSLTFTLCMLFILSPHSVSSPRKIKGIFFLFQFFPSEKLSCSRFVFSLIVWGCDSSLSLSLSLLLEDSIFYNFQFFSLRFSYLSIILCAPCVCWKACCGGLCSSCTSQSLCKFLFEPSLCAPNYRHVCFS